MNQRRTLFATASAAAVTLAVPAVAQGASATVTGSDGAPVALGAPVTTRHMSPQVGLAFDASERRYSVTVAGPGGAPASTGTSCLTTGAASPERVDYQGNGTYTVTVRTSPDTCAELGQPQVFTFSINAFTAVAAPADRLLTRQPGGVSSFGHVFAVEVNPGADKLELVYARNAQMAPDGGIVGGATPYVDPATGQADVTFDKPGTYTFVARASDFGPANAASPWSAPVTVRALSPFDFVSEPVFADSRGPKYRITGSIREPSARGRISVRIARGARGGKFRKLRTVKIRKGGRFAVRFRIGRPGVYRLRYVYKGSATVAAGYVQQGIRIRRTVVFG